MPKANTVQIEEFVAEILVSNENPCAPSAIAAAVEKFPGSQAIDAAFAFVSMASALENPFFRYTKSDDLIAAQIYRAIAVFIADYYAVEKLYGPSPTCLQISRFWSESGEDFFTRRITKLVTDN